MSTGIIQKLYQRKGKVNSIKRGFENIGRSAFRCIRELKKTEPNYKKTLIAQKLFNESKNGIPIQLCKETRGRGKRTSLGL